MLRVTTAAAVRCCRRFGLLLGILTAITILLTLVENLSAQSPQDTVLPVDQAALVYVIRFEAANNASNPGLLLVKDFKHPAVPFSGETKTSTDSSSTPGSSTTITTSETPDSSPDTTSTTVHGRTTTTTGGTDPDGSSSTTDSVTTTTPGDTKSEARTTQVTPTITDSTSKTETEQKSGPYRTLVYEKASVRGVLGVDLKRKYVSGAHSVMHREAIYTVTTGASGGKLYRLAFEGGSGSPPTPIVLPAEVGDLTRMTTHTSADNWSLVVFEDTLYAYNSDILHLYEIDDEIDYLSSPPPPRITPIELDKHGVIPSREKPESLVGYRGYLYGRKFRIEFRIDKIDKYDDLKVELHSGYDLGMSAVVLNGDLNSRGFASPRVISGQIPVARQIVHLVEVDDAGVVVLDDAGVAKPTTKPTTSAELVLYDNAGELVKQTSSGMDLKTFEVFPGLPVGAGNWAPIVQPLSQSEFRVELASHAPDASYYRIQALKGTEWEDLSGPKWFPDTNFAVEAPEWFLNGGVDYAIRACGYRSNTSLYVCSRSVKYTTPPIAWDVAVPAIDLAQNVALNLTWRDNTPGSFKRAFRLRGEPFPQTTDTGGIWKAVPVAAAADDAWGNSGIPMEACNSCVIWAEGRHYGTWNNAVHYSHDLTKSFRRLVDLAPHGIISPMALGYWRGSLVILDGQVGKHVSAVYTMNLTDGSVRKLTDGASPGTKLADIRIAIQYLASTSSYLYGYGTDGGGGARTFRLSVGGSTFELELLQQGANALPADHRMAGLGVVSGRLIAAVYDFTEDKLHFHRFQEAGQIAEIPADWNLPLNINGKLLRIGRRGVPLSPASGSLDPADIALLIREQFQAQSRLEISVTYHDRILTVTTGHHVIQHFVVQELVPGEAYWHNIGEMGGGATATFRQRRALVQNRMYSYRACGIRGNGELIACSHPETLTPVSDDVVTAVHPVDVSLDTALWAGWDFKSSNTEMARVEYIMADGGTLKRVLDSDGETFTSAGSNLSVSRIFQPYPQGKTYIVNVEAPAPLDGNKYYSLKESLGSVTGEYVNVNVGAGAKARNLLDTAYDAAKKSFDTVVFEGLVYALHQNGTQLLEIDIRRGTSRRVAYNPGSKQDFVTAAGIGITLHHLAAHRGYLYGVGGHSGNKMGIYRFSGIHNVSGKLVVEKTHAGDQFDARVFFIRDLIVLHGIVLILCDWDANADDDVDDSGDLKNTLIHLADMDTGAVQDALSLDITMDGYTFNISNGKSIDVEQSIITAGGIDQMLALESYERVPSSAANWRPEVERQSGQLLVNLPAEAPDVPYYRIQWRGGATAVWTSASRIISGRDANAGYADTSVPIRIPLASGFTYSVRVCAHRSNTTPVFCSQSKSVQIDPSEVAEDWTRDMAVGIGRTLKQAFFVDLLTGQARVLRAGGATWPSPPDESMSPQCTFQHNGELWFGDDQLDKFRVWNPLTNHWRDPPGVAAEFDDGQTNVTGCAYLGGHIYVAGGLAGFGRLTRLTLTETGTDVYPSASSRQTNYGLTNNWQITGLTPWKGQLVAVGHNAVSVASKFFKLAIDEGASFGTADGLDTDEHSGVEITAVMAAGEVLYATAVNEQGEASLYRRHRGAPLFRIGEAENFDLSLTEARLTGSQGESLPVGLTLFNPPSHTINSDVSQGRFTERHTTGLSLAVLQSTSDQDSYDIEVNWDIFAGATGYEIQRTSLLEVNDGSGWESRGDSSSDSHWKSLSNAELTYKGGHVSYTDDAIRLPEGDGSTPFYLVSYAVRPAFEQPGMQTEYGPISPQESVVLTSSLYGQQNSRARGFSPDMDPLGLDSFIEGVYDEDGTAIFGLAMLGRSVDGPTARNALGVGLGMAIAFVIATGFSGPQVRGGRMAATVMGVILWLLAANTILGVPTYWIAGILSVMAMLVVYKIYRRVPHPSDV